MWIKLNLFLNRFSLNKLSFSKKKYQFIRKKTKDLLIAPLKVMALLVAVSGLFAMIFEVRHYSNYILNIYLTRLSATLISFMVLVLLYTKKGSKKPEALVHVLLITIIVSSGYMILLMPKTLVVNAQIVGLMIFTSALFLSWELKNQIIVSIYYNLVFSSAILFNDHEIYFLPNMYESVLFVLFLSVVSVIGSAINYRLRMQIAEKTYNIEKSEKKFRSIFDNSAEGIFQASLDGKFLTVNPALVKLLGYDNKEEMMQLDIKKDIYKYSEERDLIIKKLREEGSITNFWLTLKKKDGSDVIVRMNDRLVIDEENETIIFEGNMQDITQQVLNEKRRRKAERELKDAKSRADNLAKEAMKSNVIKSQFLANMSHEIRTPMNGVIGYLSLIEQNVYEDKKEMDQFIRNAKSSAESLLEIINNILDLSKIESGKLELGSYKFNLNEVINNAVSVISIGAKEKGLRISKNIQDNVPLDLIGDPTRIRQIFTNLLGNALKFTEKGEIKIDICLKDAEDNKAELYCSVTDSGIGIPEAKQKELFKPFSQIDNSETKKFGGTGLGLVISKEFITMMEGTIGVESKENEGTKFLFTLKLKSQNDLKPVLPAKSFNRVYNLSSDFETKKELPETKIELKDKRKSFKILLAEDNLINQKVTERILTDHGLKTETVKNGLEAVDAVMKNYFDLILMDVQMPGMDGLAAASEIRKMNDAEKKNIPIIALTAHALNGDKEKCLAIGMNDYVTKPIDSDKLLNIIDNLLKIQPSKIEIKENENTVEENNFFDLSHLEKISAGDQQFQRDILLTFIEDITQRFNDLKKYFDEKDIQKITAQAHTIKGASFSIGAKKIGEEALAIEISCKHNDFDNIESRINSLAKVLSKTNEIMKGVLSEKDKAV